MVWSGHLQENGVGDADDEVVVETARVVEVVDFAVEYGEVREVPAPELDREDQALQQINHFRRHRRLVRDDQDALVQQNDFPESPHQIHLLHGKDREKRQVQREVVEQRVVRVELQDLVSPP